MTLRGTYSADAIHDVWESIYRGNAAQDALNEAIASRIFRYLNLPTGCLVLDAGCGTGDHSRRIAERGHYCVCTDISESILLRARKNLAAHGLESRASFVCQALEDLSFPDATFDAVHCRGVLMHIPQWKRALANLCRVLRPGGGIVVMENNHRSVEAATILLVRKFQARKSKLAKTEDGYEFWSEESGQPFVVRIARVRALEKEFEANGISPLKRFATGFWDVGRFPAGVPRRAAMHCNRLYFALGLPPTFSAGNAIIGRKVRGDDASQPGRAGCLGGSRRNSGPLTS